jgi:hypothetical protein
MGESLLLSNAIVRHLNITVTQRLYDNPHGNALARHACAR